MTYVSAFPSLLEKYVKLLSTHISYQPFLLVCSPCLKAELAEYSQPLLRNGTH